MVARVVPAIVWSQAYPSPPMRSVRHRTSAQFFRELEGGMVIGRGRRRLGAVAHGPALHVWLCSSLAPKMRGGCVRFRSTKSTMSFTMLALIVGAILILMALLGTLVERLPMSPSMLYLAIGYALGPAVWNVMAPDPLRHSGSLERISEVALLISLFAVG